jgi:hypothetical protein
MRSMTLRLVRSSLLWTNYMRFPSVCWASIDGMSFSRNQINPKRGIRARFSIPHIKQIGSYKRMVCARSRLAHSQVTTNSGWKCIPVEEYFFKNWGIGKWQVVKCWSVTHLLTCTGLQNSRIPLHTGVTCRPKTRRRNRFVDPCLLVALKFPCRRFLLPYSAQVHSI